MLSQPSWEKRTRVLELEVPKDCAPREAAAMPFDPYTWAVDHLAVVNIFDRAITRPEVLPVGPAVVTRALIMDHTASTDLATDLNAGHLRNARRIFAYMAETANGHGARLAVLLVPSKERALARGLLAPELERALQGEDALFAQFDAILDSLGVPHADATPSLARTVGAESYPPFDGHPFADGYRLYAETARSLLGP